MNRIIYPILVSISLVLFCFFLFGDIETYFSDLLKDVSSFATTYAWVSFLILASDILLPVPSSIVMYSNGLVLGGFQGAALSLISLIISNSIGYWLGFAFGHKKEPNLNAKKLLFKYGALAILISRGIPILSESVSITAGFNKLDFRNYSFLNTLGCLPICLVYAGFGALGKGQNLFLISFACSILVALLFFILGKKLLRQSKNDKELRD